VRAVKVQPAEGARQDVITSGKFKAIFGKYFQFDPRSNFLAELHSKEKGKSGAAQRIELAHKAGQSIVQAEERTGPDTLDHQYMHEQLETYQPVEADRLYRTSDSVFETIQVVGIRSSEEACAEKSGATAQKNGSPGSQAKGCEVHVYEMFWADLSRVSSDLWRVLVDFFQLLAYLCGIGRKSLDFARAALPYSPWWTWFARAQFGAELTLTQAVLVLNFFLLGLASFVLPFKVAPASHYRVGVVILILSLALGTAVFLYWKRDRFRPQKWPFLLAGSLALGALGFTAAEVLGHKHPYLFFATLALGWWSGVSALILWAMKAYNRRVPGAFATSVVCAALGWITFLIELLYHQSTDAGASLGTPILSAAAETAEVFLIVLVGAWFFFFVCTFVASFVGFGVTRFACAQCVPADKEAACRAIWTVNLILVVSAAVTLIANLAVWKALSLAVEKFGDHPLRLGVSSPLDRFIPHGTVNTTVDFMNSVIGTLASGWFTIFFCGFGLAALIAIWSLFPAVISKNPPNYDSSATWLGEALSAGYRAMRTSGEIIRSLVVLGSPLILAILYYRLNPSSRLFAFASGRIDQPAILSTFGLILLLMLTVSQGPFRFLALGFRSVIDIALDVANWLRLHPKDQNPKARISARCVSQLEYLADWRDPRDAGGYNAFVIVAHSQGTVIVSEILRFLQVEQHPLIKALAGRKLYLFTMGCPLRQLYSLRFPHQYAWARHNAAAWAGAEPNPTHLGVAQWVNAYRSGDYVGRYLWHPDSGDNPWGEEAYEESPATPGTRREFCIGAGGHTHYWDTTAPKIGKELDRLIGAACEA
jgi:hypothetical protein